MLARCALLVLLVGGVAHAEPSGFVLLSPKSIRKDLGKDKVVLKFDLPCKAVRAIDAATFIAASDDTGDLVMVFGLLYPAGYCMDYVNDPKGRPQKNYEWTISAKKYGINSDVTLKALRPLRAKR